MKNITTKFLRQSEIIKKVMMLCGLMIILAGCEVGGYAKYINPIKEQVLFGEDVTNEEYFKSVIGLKGDMNWTAFQSGDDISIMIVELNMSIPEYSGWKEFSELEWRESKVQWKINSKTMVTELGYIGFDGAGVAIMNASFRWGSAPLARLSEQMAE